MIERLLRDKYEKYLDGLDIYENNGSLILSKIIIKKDYRQEGIGSKIMFDLIKYADENKQIIALTPSDDFGGNKNKLIQFYKKFGFKLNKGYHKNYEFNYLMIRYPKLSETNILIKKLLRESLLTRNNDDILKITNFINFAKQYLNITDDIKIYLAFERTPELKTTAYYDLNGVIMVYCKNRAIIDICRSIAHELTHHKQNIENRLTNIQKDGADGSPIENEANSMAGIIIRKYGKLNPDIYI